MSVNGSVDVRTTPENFGERSQQTDTRIEHDIVVAATIVLVAIAVYVRTVVV